MTEQVEAEFLNNRQRVIASALTNLKAPTIPNFMPAYLSDSKTAAALSKNINQVKERIRVIKQRVERILKDPNANDPVFKSFSRIVANSSRNFNFLRPEQNKRIFELALQRHERGFPPRKPDAQSMGDAINWEWILDSAKLSLSDVLIVSRDGDYGLLRGGVCYLNDWLAGEFRNRVSPKRKAELIPSLSQALKQLKIKVTVAEEREEENIIKRQIRPLAFQKLRSVPPGFWQAVLDRVKNSDPHIYIYLNETDSLLLENGNLMIYFPPKLEDNISKIDNENTRALLRSILSEFGYEVSTISFLLNLTAASAE